MTRGEKLFAFARTVLGISRRIFFSAVGLLAKLFLGSNPVVDPFSDEKLPLPRIAVLGRGKSSELFIRAAKEKSFSAVILCNFENRELASPELQDAIRQVPSVILLTNIMEPAPSFRVAKFIGVNCAIIIRRANDLRRKRKIWRLNRLGLPVQPLPDSLSTELKSKTQGTGIVGVAIGSILSDNVEVFGIEFYRSDYIVGNFAEITGEKGESVRAGASQSVQDGFERIATHQASTRFILHCFEDHVISLENVTVSRVASEA